MMNVATPTKGVEPSTSASSVVNVRGTQRRKPEWWRGVAVLFNQAAVFAREVFVVESVAQTNAVTSDATTSAVASGRREP